MFSCPNCGSPDIRFDVPSQKLKCQHCESLFDPSAYQTDGVADEHIQYGATVYTCSQCGAELISTDQEAVGFCTYCGASGVLESRFAAEKRPAWIIPFKVSRETCKEEYAKLIRNSWYAPKEFRDPEYIDTFRGIYIPYWMYAVRFAPQVSLPAEKNYTSGSYRYHEQHTVTAKLSGEYRGIPYDASSSFDDTIAENIAPYHEQAIVPFQPGYLPGFFADTADVDDRSYVGDAVARAAKNVIQDVVQVFSRKDMTIRRPSGPEAQALLQTQCTSCESTLFPVWFLTWRKKDRVAYVVMNGETGRISADLPVDLKRFFLFSLGAAAVIFLIMSLFVSMAAPTALFLSSLLAVIASGLFLHEIMALHDRENHIFDKGYFLSRRQAKIPAEVAERIRQSRLAEEERKERTKASAGKLLSPSTIFLSIFILPFLGAFGIIIASFMDMMPSTRAIPGCLVTAVIGLVYFVRLLPLLPRVQKNTLFQALPSFIAELLAFVIAVAHPVSDYAYYVGCILCLAGVLVTCVSLITKYDLLATRPVPQFHDRGFGTGPAKQTQPQQAPQETPKRSLHIFDKTGRFLAVLAGIGLLLAVVLAGRATAHAAASLYIDPETGYDDEQDLLTDAEEAALLEDMRPVTEFGGAAFVSTANYGESTSAYAKQLYRSYFGSDSGTLFLIDMGQRNIWVHSNGAIYRTITKAYATSITDNVYTYASAGDYYTCAAEVFRQEITLLRGGRIARPMKHITNALVSLALGLLINFIALRRRRKIRKADDRDVFKAIVSGVSVASAGAVMLSRTRHYVGSSSSGGGGGFGGGGGGFSGGGGGGGGGGHSF